MASQVLESWSNLKEVFRIPKKEQIEKMKEHEREADEGREDQLPDIDESFSKQSSYDRRPNNHHRMDLGHRDSKDKAKRTRESPDRENRKVPRLEVDKYIKFILIFLNSFITVFNVFSVFPKRNDEGSSPLKLHSRMKKCVLEDAKKTFGGDIWNIVFHLASSQP